MFSVLLITVQANVRELQTAPRYVRALQALRHQAQILQSADSRLRTVPRYWYYVRAMLALKLPAILATIFGLLGNPQTELISALLPPCLPDLYLYTSPVGTRQSRMSRLSGVPSSEDVLRHTVDWGLRRLKGEPVDILTLSHSATGLNQK